MNHTYSWPRAFCPCAHYFIVGKDRQHTHAIRILHCTGQKTAKCMMQRRARGVCALQSSSYNFGAIPHNHFRYSRCNRQRSSHTAVESSQGLVPPRPGACPEQVVHYHLPSWPHPPTVVLVYSTIQGWLRWAPGASAIPGLLLFGSIWYSILWTLTHKN